MPTSRTRKTGGVEAEHVGTDAGEEVRAAESDEEIEAAIFELVNQERRRRNIPAVARDEKLGKVARKYAQLMAERNEMGHYVGGTNPGQRITAGGYRWSRYGENVARGYTTAQAVMNGWMNSPGHRANILNSLFKDLGVGVAARANGTKFFCQNFASPRSGRASTGKKAPATSSIAVEEEYGDGAASSGAAEDEGPR